MKKLLLVLAVVVATASFANAQDKKWNIGFGGGVAMPSGDASDSYKTGFDGSISGTYNFTPKFAAGLEYNYTTLSGKSIGSIGMLSIDAPSLAISAFLVKGIYTFTEEGFRPYVGLSTGMYSSKVDVEGAEASNKIGFGAEVGAKLKKWNVGLAYHMAGSEEGSSLNIIQINLGYTISF